LAGPGRYKDILAGTADTQPVHHLNDTFAA
jgi:hypothetical protein